MIDAATSTGDRSMTGLTATEVRSKLDHPVIDIDGHTVEFFPALAGELVKEGVDLDGESMPRRTSGTFGPSSTGTRLTPEERADRRVARGPWGNGGMELALDRATAMLPRLLYERLPELGIDVSVIYPSFGLLFGHFDDERDRRGACRALNRFNAGVFAEFADRLLPVAEIPMHTPEEAVDELEHAAALGFRAVVMAGFVQRPIAAAAAVDPELARVRGVDRHLRARQRLRLRPGVAEVPRARHRARLPLLGDGMAEPRVDLELRLQPRRHARREPPRARQVAVPRRRHPPVPRPQLRVPRGRRGLGGVALRRPHRALGEAQRRSHAPPRPDNVDWDEFADLFARYGGEWAAMAPKPTTYPEQDLALLDEFAACGIERPRTSASCSWPRSSAAAKPTTR